MPLEITAGTLCWDELLTALKKSGQKAIRIKDLKKIEPKSIKLEDLKNPNTFHILKSKAFFESAERTGTLSLAIRLKVLKKTAGGWTVSQKEVDKQYNKMNSSTMSY